MHLIEHARQALSLPPFLPFSLLPVSDKSMSHDAASEDRGGWSRIATRARAESGVFSRK